MEVGLLRTVMCIVLLLGTSSARTLARAAPHACSVASGGFGSIEGVVVDILGRAVSGATVYAEFNGPQAGIVPTTRADEDGKFAFEAVEAGSYSVVAGKREDGYADPLKDFYDPGGPFTEVTVRSNDVVRGVVVRLGKKSARIRGTIADATTGLPLSRAGMEFIHASEIQLYRGASVGRQGKFDILVPSTIAFRLKFSAPGYESSYHGPDGTLEQAEVVHMRPGETKDLSIRLKPIK